jgi:hypothetical protein
MRIAVAAAVTVVVVAVFIGFAGCEFNPPDAPTDGAMSCTTSSDSCVCLSPPGVCVQCTVDDERNCTGATPQCGDDNSCRGCRANDECASGACLEDGRCADAGQVIYAAPAGLQTSPCGVAPGQNECSITQALLEIAGSRIIIRLAPGAYIVGGASGLDFQIGATLIARGATITRQTGSNGPFLNVRSSQTVKLVGGTLRGPNDSDAIRCNAGSRLQVHEATVEDVSQAAIAGPCEIVVSRSILRRNLGGGIRMTSVSQAAITNNFIHHNGTTGNSTGGMDLRLAAGSRVELNTVVDNVASTNAGNSGGISCEGQGYDAPYNLVYRNQGGAGGAVQVIGTCTFQGSFVQAGGVAENAVGFEAPNDATSPSYRLTAGAPLGTIRDGFDCTGIDFDGDLRPAPSGGKCDFGADEYRAGQ